MVPSSLTVRSVPRSIQVYGANVSRVKGLAAVEEPPLRVGRPWDRGIG